jgi:hypothetical protein
MIFTIAELRQMGACSSDVDKLAALFGTSVEVTEANILAAYAADIAVDWWGDQVFGAEYKRVAAPAWTEYERVRATALAEYERVRATALAEYERVAAPAWTEYKRVTAPAWTEYERVAATAWTEYERVRAGLICELAARPT